MILRSIKNNQNENLDFIRSVYEKSFPCDERREFDLVIGLIEHQPNFHLLLIENDGIPVGILSYWIWDGLAYVEHFAIDSRVRGGGLGAQALQQLIEQLRLPIILEVEKPEDELSRRRISFYRRLGFTLWPEHHYIQPAYDPGKQALPLLLMTHGLEKFDDKQFKQARRLIYSDVYRTTTTE